MSAAGEQPARAGERSGRRELAVAVLVAVLAAALALTAGGQEWAEVTAQRTAPLPPVSAVITGSEAAPLVPAAGLVLLAAAGALLAVRGVGRVAVGVVMVLAGAGLAWSSGRVLTGLDVVTARLRALGVPAGELSTDVAAALPALVVVAGVLGVAAGGLAVVRGRRWPGLGRRHERPAAASAPVPARARTEEDRALDAWRALDRGEDPTDPASGTTEQR
ncbi:TIGR02234 family membrane protein [Geodermatophilus sp. DF01-2]|uniref:Trp biosynthesis-associated membrane protein n=1 Tax=Geodermatophilus sp. DF01-2 TaxID=2559610 RepID=UPI0010742DD0|nr:Trp biosynthesis-associated membrane protein [Geodermatophilus sp. DF01_2]TFV59051.1 TIGR02234 family membrane protein [Geodermatophilus sp. DF01_2]